MRGILTKANTPDDTKAPKVKPRWNYSQGPKPKDWDGSTEDQTKPTHVDRSVPRKKGYYPSEVYDPTDFPGGESVPDAKAYHQGAKATQDREKREFGEGQRKKMEQVAAVPGAEYGDFVPNQRTLPKGTVRPVQPQAPTSAPSEHPAIQRIRELSEGAGSTAPGVALPLEPDAPIVDRPNKPKPGPTARQDTRPDIDRMNRKDQTARNRLPLPYTGAKEEAGGKVVPSPKEIQAPYDPRIQRQSPSMRVRPSAMNEASGEGNPGKQLQSIVAAHEEARTAGKNPYSEHQTFKGLLDSVLHQTTNSHRMSNSPQANPRLRDQDRSQNHRAAISAIDQALKMPAYTPTGAEPSPDGNQERLLSDWNRLQRKETGINPKLGGSDKERINAFLEKRRRQFRDPQTGQIMNRITPDKTTQPKDFVEARKVGGTVVSPEANPQQMSESLKTLQATDVHGAWDKFGKVANLLHSHYLANGDNSFREVTDQDTHKKSTGFNSFMDVGHAQNFLTGKDRELFDAVTSMPTKEVNLHPNIIRTRDALRQKAERNASALKTEQVRDIIKTSKRDLDQKIKTGQASPKDHQHFMNIVSTASQALPAVMQSDSIDQNHPSAKFLTSYLDKFKNMPEVAPAVALDPATKQSLATQAKVTGAQSTGQQRIMGKPRVTAGGERMDTVKQNSWDDQTNQTLENIVNKVHEQNPIHGADAKAKYAMQILRESDPTRFSTITPSAQANLHNYFVTQFSSQTGEEAKPHTLSRPNSPEGKAESIFQDSTEPIKSRIDKMREVRRKQEDPNMKTLDLKTKKSFPDRIASLRKALKPWQRD